MKFRKLLLFVYIALSFSFISYSFTACGTPSGSEKASENVQGEGSIKDTHTEKPNEGKQPKDSGVEVATDKGSESIPDPTAPEEKSLPDPTAPEEASMGKEGLKEAAKEQIPESQPQTKNIVFVYNSNYKSGSFSIFDGNQKKIVKTEQTLPSGDSVATQSQGVVTILNRFNKASKEDSASLIGANDWKLAVTLKLGARSNPHDVVFTEVSGKFKVYISFYGKKELGIFDQAGKKTGTIDLSSLSEKSSKACSKDSECVKYGQGSGKCDTASKICQNDGLPEMSKMFIHKDKLFVLIQGLDRNQGFKPIKSYVAIINTTTDKIVKKLTLKGTNPTAFVREPSGTYLIVCSGSAIDSTDGGIERLDPSKETLGGKFIITEKTLGGGFPYGPGTVVVSSEKAYIMITDKSYKNSLVEFNPTKGTVTKILLKKANLSTIALAPNGELYIGDKTPTSSGIRIFDTKSNTEITKAPISSGSLAPNQFVFIPPSN